MTPRKLEERVRVVVRIVDGATFPESRLIGARWRKRDGRGLPPFAGFALLPEGADPSVAAAQWRARDGYSCAVVDLQRDESRKRHPRRRVSMRELAAMAIPKQLPLLGKED